MTKKRALMFKAGPISGPIIKKCVFDHGSSKNLTIRIYSKGAAVTSRNWSDAAAPRLSDHWGEIIKRSLLMLLAQTGECKEKYKVTCFVGGKRAVRWKHPFQFLKGIKQAVLEPQAKQDLLFLLEQQTRSQYGRSVVCFENYAMATAQSHHFERFRYLFTAFNAFYEGLPLYLTKKRRKETDKIQDAILNQFFGEKERLLFVQKDSCFFSTLDLSNPDSALDLLKRKYRDQALNRSFRSFVVADYSYYLRCKYFHGEKQIPLVCFENDREMNNLKICNKELLEFLHTNMGRLFAKERESLEKANREKELEKNGTKTIL